MYKFCIQKIKGVYNLQLKTNLKGKLLTFV